MHAHRLNPGRRPLAGREVALVEPVSGGFTRVELLAVSVAATLLFSLLLPAMANSRSKAARMGCVDNLREVGRAFREYGADFDGRFPMMVSTFEGGSAEHLGASDAVNAVWTWAHFRSLSNYLATPALLVCPSDEGRSVADDFAGLEGATARNAAISYGVGTEALDGTTMLLAADRSMVGGRLNFEFDGAAIRGNIRTNLESLSTLHWATNGMHRQAGNTAVGDGSVRQLSDPGLRDLIYGSAVFDVRINYSQPGKTADE